MELGRRGARILTGMSLADVLPLLPESRIAPFRSVGIQSREEYATGRRTSRLDPVSHSNSGHLPSDPRIRKGEAPQVDWLPLVKRCMDGDNLAWAELVKAQHKRIYALCYRFTGSQQDAEDLTQDVFIKLHDNLRSFDLAKGSFQTWLTTLTRNLLVDHFRRTRQLRVTDSMDAGWEGIGEQRMPEPIPDRRSSPHDQAVRKELEEMVQAALVKVSPELREAVILRDLQDMDYKDIAQVLHIPEGTVKSRISRGRAELARLLKRTKSQVV